MTQLQTSSGRLTLNGQACRHCLELEISQSSYVEAATFRACLWLGNDPADQVIWDLLNSTSGNAAALEAVIELGTVSGPPSPIVLQPILIGSVDQISLDVARNLVEVEGRDFLAALMRVSTQDSFVNQTSSQIVSDLATAAGLNLNVADTTTIVGQYYQIEHSRGRLDTFSRFSNGLDVVSYLARLEQFDCWVDGKVLNFQPRDTNAPPAWSINMADLAPNAGQPNRLRSLRLDRRLALDGDPQIILRSWNSRQRSAVEKSYPQSASGEKIIFVSPNLAEDTALQQAEALFADISRHRKVISGEMVGDLGLAPRSIITLSGSPGWDGTYAIDQVIRTLSGSTGFSQNFVARAT